MRILLVEDDPVLADLLTQSLTQHRYAVDWVEDGALGLEYAQDAQYDLILTDVGLPRLDGITLCQRLRDIRCGTPVLMMTAKDASNDRIRGLDAGADDYLTKPINLEELLARVRALLRRGTGERSPLLELHDLKLDPIACTVTYANKPLHLTPKEYGLLELFLRYPARVFSLGNMIEHLWTFDDPPLEESVKSHIKGLRQKLKTAGAANWVENVYGLGYRLNPPNSSNSSNSSPLPPAPCPPASSPIPYNQALSALWLKHHSTMLDRLQTLKQAAAALEQNQLQPELRYSAEQAAHKLAGVLGMFERDAGTAVARQLEDLLSGSEPLKLKQIRSLLHPLIEIINTPVSEVSAVEISETSPEVSLGISPEVSPKISLEATAVLPSSRSAMLDRPHASVLAVDDDPVILEMLKTVLEPWGIQVTGLSDSSQFWQTLRAVSPDLLILDVEMPQIGGIDLCQSLRSELEWQALPVVFLTAHRGSTIIQQVFSVGADDYVSKPVMEAELVARINNRLDRSRLLQTLSRQEPMTGLLNQPASSHALKNLLSAYPQGCLLLFQIQNLRQIQRRYGHAAGHLVLQRWGKLFQQRLPDNSVMGYWGEGEFVVGLPQISAVQVTEAIGDLLAGLKQQVFKAPVENQFVEKVGKITGKITDRFQVQWDWMIVSFPGCAPNKCGQVK